MRASRARTRPPYSWKLFTFGAVALHMPYLVMAFAFHEGSHAGAILAMLPIAPGFCASWLAAFWPNPDKVMIFVSSGILTGLMHLAAMVGLRYGRRAWLRMYVAAVALDVLSFWIFYNVMSM